jgi:hypothetical protein
MSVGILLQIRCRPSPGHGFHVRGWNDCDRFYERPTPATPVNMKMKTTGVGTPPSLHRHHDHDPCATGEYSHQSKSQATLTCLEKSHLGKVLMDKLQQLTTVDCIFVLEIGILGGKVFDFVERTTPRTRVIAHAGKTDRSFEWCVIVAHMTLACARSPAVQYSVARLLLQ